MQKAYLMSLYEKAAENPDVLLLLADSGASYDALFRQELPSQILDFGIAEENMVAAAAGMASCGKIPFVYTAGAFLAYRSLEFIRDDVCLQNMNVKLVGMGTGLAWSTLGPTHHTTEDLGVLRCLPGLVVLTPSCPSAAAKCVDAAYAHTGPVYLRIGMGGEMELYGSEYTLEIGKNIILREGGDVAVFACGAVCAYALEAAEILSANGISVSVIDTFSVSPFDRQGFLAQAESKKAVFTVEEHSVTGGIGSAAAEILAEQGMTVRFARLGITGGFARGYGTHEDVLHENGLDAQGIAAQIMKSLSGWNIL